MADAPASYRLIDIDREPGGWRVTMTLKRHHAASGDFVAVDRECWLAPRAAPA
jgi:hypothetical protein